MGPFSRTLSILAYHRVLADPDPLIPSQPCAKDFEAQLAAVNRWFKVLPLSKAVAMLDNDSLPVRAACITFDDGYADNATIALPILRRHDMVASFFVTTGFLNGGRMWNDTVIESVRKATGASLQAPAIGLGNLNIGTLAARRSTVNDILKALKYLPLEERQQRADYLAAIVGAPLPVDLMLTSEQVCELQHNGMEIGAHTVNHPILSKVDPTHAQREIIDSKRALEAITARPVKLFAYPNGKPGVDYTSSHVDMVRSAGFEAAVSTSWGVALPKTDRYELPRFTPWDKAPGRFVLRMLRNTLRTTPAYA